jgi:hypothetical protein
MGLALYREADTHDTQICRYSVGTVPNVTVVAQMLIVIVEFLATASR